MPSSDVDPAPLLRRCAQLAGSACRRRRATLSGAFLALPRDAYPSPPPRSLGGRRLLTPLRDAPQLCRCV